MIMKENRFEKVVAALKGIMNGYNNPGLMAEVFRLQINGFLTQIQANKLYSILDPEHIYNAMELYYEEMGFTSFGEACMKTLAA